MVARILAPAQLPSLRLRLRLPAGDTLTGVQIGGTPVPFDADGTIDLSGRGASVDLQATIAAAAVTGP